MLTLKALPRTSPIVSCRLTILASSGFNTTSLQFLPVFLHDHPLSVCVSAYLSPFSVFKRKVYNCLLFCVHVCEHVCQSSHAKVHEQRSEDNSWDSAFSFCCVGSGTELKSSGVATSAFAPETSFRPSFFLKGCSSDLP